MLDLFAGSGALAIEALSRGAAQATLVDTSPAALTAIRRNLEALGIEADVSRQPALRFLEASTRAATSIRSGLRRPSISPREFALHGADRGAGAGARPQARVVAESDRRHPLELGLDLLDERRYGDTLIKIHGSR